MNLSEKKAYVEANLHYLPDFEKKAFDFNFLCVLTKNSVGMESGNTAQLEDVVAVVKGHPSKLAEGLKREIYNHYAAYLKMLEYLKQHPEGYLDEEIIKDIHEVLVKGIIEEGGVYRNVNISIKGSKYVPCDPIKVYHRMDKYVVQLNEMPNDLDKVVYAHLQLSKIHPFLDGNGRLCRLILNYMLISEGYLPISIPAKRRKEYFATLEAFKVDKTSVPFANLLNDLLNKEYDRLIELIEPHVK
jgi:Fic family protein